MADVPKLPGRRRSELELQSALRRFYDLSPVDQLRAFEAMREYLGERLAENEADQQISERAGALEALADVAATLALPEGKAPNTTQFRTHAPTVAAGWNVNRVKTAWEKWSFAVDVYEGRRINPSVRRLELRRARGGRRPIVEDYLTAVRIWLDTKPLHETTGMYNAWAVEYNDQLPTNELPVPLAAAIVRNLEIGWALVVQVAKSELTLAQARDQDKATRRRTEWSRGPHRLISLRGIGTLTELEVTQVHRLTHQPGFPAAVLNLSGVRAWLEDDVQAYLEGRPFPQRRPGELQGMYMSHDEVGRLLDRQMNTSRFRRLPAPAGLIGSRRFWLRSEVEQWIEENPYALGRRSPAKRR